METPLLNGEVIEDYAPVRSWKEMKSMFWTETVKIWKIAGPLVFNILCQYGTNSITSIFVGHLGDIQLSSVTISLAVIGTFSFGFMVSAFCFVASGVD